MLIKYILNKAHQVSKSNLAGLQKKIKEPWSFLKKGPYKYGYGYLPKGKGEKL
jgi:hypothetical protein